MILLRFGFVLFLLVFILAGSISAYGWPYFGYSSNYFTPYGSIYIYQFPQCGDGRCDFSEWAYGTCPIDCMGPVPSYPRCGDGLCSFYEYRSGTCPQDCVVNAQIGNAPYYPTPTPQPIFCSDGTPAGMCSGTPGVYCNAVGNLTNNPNLCPCPSGYYRNGNLCSNLCSDGTLVGACSTVSSGQKCNYNGILVNSWGPNSCGCPLGKQWNGNTCADPVSSCTMTVNPKPYIVDSNTYNVNDGKANVVLTYNNTAPTTANILCGNGVTITAGCVANPGAGGTCTATCVYANSGPYPSNKIIDATLDTGVKCGSQPIQVIAPQAVNGTVVVSVTDCQTGRSLQSSLVQVTSPGTYDPTYATGVYADSSGSVLFTQMPPATYNLQVSKPNYTAGQLSVNTRAGVTVPASICLNPTASTCQFNAYVLGITTPDNINSNQVKYNLIATAGNASYIVTPSYQSSIPITFSSGSFAVSQGSYLLNFTATPSDPNFVGSAYANIVLQTNQSGCGASLLVPIVIPGMLTANIDDNSRTTFPGGRECFNLILNNKFSDSVNVILSTSSGLFPVSFDYDKIRLARGEISSDKMCVTVPAYQSTGATQTISVTALNNFGPSAYAYASINVPSQTAFSASSSNDLSQCLELPSNSIVYHKITLTNSAKSDNYNLVVGTSDDIKVSLLSDTLLGFQKGTQQQAVVIVDPSGAQTQGDHYYTLKLLNNGVTAFQQTLCYKIKPVFSVSTSLSQTSLILNYNETQTDVLTLKNIGNIRDSYVINARSRAIILSQSSLTLNAGEDYDIGLLVDASKGSIGLTQNAGIDIFSLNKVSNTLTKLTTVTLPITIKRKPTTKSDLDVIFVSDPDVSFNGNQIFMKFLVRNNGANAITSGLDLRGFPIDWQFNFTPGKTINLNSGQELHLNVTITVPQNSEAKEYDGQLTLISQDGLAEKDKDIIIDATQAGSGTPFTSGQFLSGVSNIVLILIVLLIIAGVILYLSRKNLTKLKQ